MVEYDKSSTFVIDKRKGKSFLTLAIKAKEPHKEIEK
jgi:hypothetical protein